MELLGAAGHPVPNGIAVDMHSVGRCGHVRVRIEVRTQSDQKIGVVGGVVRPDRIDGVELVKMLVGCVLADLE
ncbi:hypothetical protein [Rhodococcus opacus]|uniref:hypothetical protein n=1 Tax=Rhodococcus opacus TaxID=37919 RepID=UPI00294ABB48|nr:hypothetical protein [Rhodococcus opacus]